MERWFLHLSYVLELLYTLLQHRAQAPELGYRLLVINKTP
jgi:hypothetical protein